MTDKEFIAWLRDSRARRCAIVEVDTDTPRRLAVFPYTTTPDDADLPNISYTARVRGGVAFTESLPLSGSARASYGDIELDNTDGALDEWLLDVWVNRDVRVYLGDVTWPRGQFRLIMSGVCEDLRSRTPERLNIVLRDKLELLNTAVSEATLGGSTVNKDRLLPVCLGECHNITPLALNPDINETQIFHVGQVERVIEARDNAVPVATTDSLAEGRTTLNKSPAGQVTLSVQGDKTGGIYRNTVGALIQLLMTEYGPFDDSDLDSDNFAAFELAHPQPVGVYIPDRRTVIDVCRELAASVGANLAPSRLGLMRLLKIELPPMADPVSITPDSYEMGSLRLLRRSTVVAGVRLGYCRNWTPQQDIETGVPKSSRDLFEQEWLTVTATDPAVADEYKISTEVEQENTLLLTAVDAQAEADRRLALWSEPRFVFGVRCYAEMLTLDLGDAVTLYGDRFGLAGGRTGMVVGIRSDWVAGRVDLEVLI